MKQGRYTKAQVVDHIIPIRIPEGWQKRWDENNYQSLCIACHNRKTKEDQEKFHFKKVADENY
ncbi:HNH endonuclease [Lactobacillus kitasatonis]|uniref:HNH endonuclease n=1 Tax=Lactobacillus kitasatonis TaxID=237446 RepID=UPI003F668F22